MSMSEIRALVAECRASEQARATPIVAEIIDGSPRMSIPVTIERSGSEDPSEEGGNLRCFEPTWEGLSESQREAKLKQWRSWGAPKPRRNFDPIRAAFLEDWRETSSGCEIWWPM